MPVIAETVKVLEAGVSGEIAGRLPERPRTSYAVRYQLQVDDQEDNSPTIINYFRRNRTANGVKLPYIGRIYDVGNDKDEEAICVALTPKLVSKSGGIYNVDVQFEPLQGDGSDIEQRPNKRKPEEKTEDPEEWFDDIDVTYTQISVPVEEGVFRGARNDHGRLINIQFLIPGTQTPLVNSSYIPFDPTIEKEEDIKVVRISVLRQSYNGVLNRRFQGAVNNAQFTINKQLEQFQDVWEPYTARIKNINSTFTVINGVPWWRQTVEVHIHPRSWRVRLLDRGMMERQVAGDRRADGSIISPSEIPQGAAFHAPIKDADGYPFTQPVLLDGNGKPLQPGQPEIWLDYSIYPEVDFTQYTAW